MDFINKGGACALEHMQQWPVKASGPFSRVPASVDDVVVGVVVVVVGFVSNHSTGISFSTSTPPRPVLLLHII